MSRLLLPILVAAALVGAVVSVAAPVDGAFYPRVIGGEPAPEDAYGWMAALVQADTFDYADGQFCGGILISPEWVLTAAHCVEDRELSDFRVVMASDLDAPSEVLQPAAVLMHPTYFERVVRGGDLALIQLERRLEEVEPARLNKDSAYANQQSQGRILGWGRTSFDLDAPNLHPSKLQQADLQVLARGTLNTLPYYGGVIRPEFIPVGQSNPLRAAFSGDSGGPLLVQDPEGGWLVAGVASWGSGGCGDAYDHITMYSDVAYHADWIEEVVSISESYRDPDGWDPTFERAPDSKTTYLKLPLWPRNGGVGSLVRNYFDFELRWIVSFNHYDTRFPNSYSSFATFIESQGRVYGLMDLGSVTPGAPKFWRGPQTSAEGIAPGPYPIRPFQTLMLSGRYGTAQAIRVVGLNPEIEYKLPQDEYRYDGYVLYGLDGRHLSQIASTSWSRPEPFGGISEALFFSTDDASAYPWQIIPGQRAEIAMGQPHRGALSESSHPFHRPGERVESVKIVGGSHYDEMLLEVSSEFDAEISVFDQDGRKTAYLDDGGSGATERLIVLGNALSNAVVRISNFDPDEFGEFTLSPRPHTSKSSLRRGESERRALTSADEVSYQDGEPPLYYESIPLDLGSSTARVAVTVEGIGGFLPFFGVFEIPGGTLMASGGGSYCESPEIVFTPKSTHTYELWVVTLDESDLNGNYDVSVATKTSSALGDAAPQARSAKAERQIRFRQLGARARPTPEEIQQALVDAYLNSNHTP